MRDLVAFFTQKNPLLPRGIEEAVYIGCAGAIGLPATLVVQLAGVLAMRASFIAMNEHANAGAPLNRTNVQAELTFRLTGIGLSICALAFYQLPSAAAALFAPSN